VRLLPLSPGTFAPQHDAATAKDGGSPAFELEPRSLRRIVPSRKREPIVIDGAVGSRQARAWAYPIRSGT